MKSTKIVAILGMPGSGKSEAIRYLEKKYAWPKVYFGDVTFDEMKARELAVNEKNERMTREDLRARFGLDHYAKKVVEKIESISNVKTILVESLYSWEEYLVLKERFEDAMLTIAIHASPQTRHARLAKRPRRPLSAEEARSRDYAQIENLHQGGPIAMADRVVVNEGTMEEMCKQFSVLFDKNSCQ